MTVTAYTINLVDGKTDNSEPWVASAYSADWQAAEIIKAAPGVGYALCINRIDFMAQDDFRLSMGSAELTSAIPDASRIFQIKLNEDGGGQISIKYLRPIQFPENTPIVVDSAASADDGAVVVQGFTRKTT